MCGRVAAPDCHLPPPSDCQLDSTASQLTPQEPQLCLVDAGYFLNTSCPSMFRSGRRLDLILAFDYSLPSPFEVPLVVPWERQTPCSQATLQERATGPLALTSWVPKDSQTPARALGWEGLWRCWGPGLPGQVDREEARWAHPKKNS